MCPYTLILSDMSIQLYQEEKDKSCYHTNIGEKKILSIVLGCKLKIKLIHKGYINVDYGHASVGFKIGNYIRSLHESFDCFLAATNWPAQGPPMCVLSVLSVCLVCLI